MVFSEGLLSGLPVPEHITSNHLLRISTRRADYRRDAERKTQVDDCEQWRE